MSLIVTGATGALGRLTIEHLVSGRPLLSQAAFRDSVPRPHTKGRSRMSELERNKQVVVDYYQTAFGGNPEKAVNDHFGDRYIQHNPDAPTERKHSSGS